MSTRTRGKRSLVCLAMAAVLAASLLALVQMMVQPKPAEAAFPGSNGKIAFISNKDGNDEIYTMNPDGADQTRITFNPQPEGSPKVSPNGKKITYTRRVSEDSSDIFVVDASDGFTTETRLTNNSSMDAQPTFSPDGKRIAFTSNRNGRFDIFVMNADAPEGPTNQPQRLTTRPGGDRYPAFSPDGTKIAYTVVGFGPTYETSVMNAADGSGKTTLNEFSFQRTFIGDWGVRFSGPPFGPPNDDFPDAREIVFSNNVGGASITGTTKAATREPGEPDHYTEAKPDADSWVGDHSVWYRWISPASGPVTIDTCTSNIDSFLAVYTGSQLNALSRVAENNNDNCGGGSGSKVIFEAVSGTTYQIAVSDAGGLREDNFTLSISPMITNVRPNDGVRGVSRNTRVTFSQEMDKGSVEANGTVMLVRWGSTTPVAATVRLSSDGKTMMLNPRANLAAGARYTVTVKGGASGAKNKAGNPLAADKVWSFITAGR